MLGIVAVMVFGLLGSIISAVVFHTMGDKRKRNISWGLSGLFGVLLFAAIYINFS